MSDLLNRILAKRGLKLTELDKEEAKQFEDWKLVLTKEELSVEDIKNFLRAQMSAIESKWSDYERTSEAKAQLIPYHTCFRLLLAAIDSPKAAREALEKNLLQLLNT